MKKFGLKVIHVRVVALLSFVVINFSLAAQVSLTIYSQKENEKDSIISQRAFDDGYLVFDNQLAPNQESGEIKLYLIDAVSNDTLQNKSFTYEDKPEHIEGRGMLFVVRETNSESGETFAVAKLDTGEDVWIMFDDSYVIFRGKIRFKESKL